MSAFGILYLHEYAGIDAVTLLDVASGTFNSGSLTTTNPTDLLFAGAASTASVSGVASPFVVLSTGRPIGRSQLRVRA